MISRRNFIKFAAVSFGSAVATACVRAVSTPPPDPTPTRVLPSPTPSPAPSATPTATSTVSPSPTQVPTPTATATLLPPEFVKVCGDQFIFRGEHFPINGFNYYPRLHPWRTFNIGEWDPQTTESELRLGVGLGANVVRTFIDFNFSLDTQPSRPPDVYFALMPQYVANFREFIDIAGRLNLKVIVTLFDGADSSIYQPSSQWMAGEYLKQFIPPFVNDPRILCWDLQNEPDRAISTVGEETVIPFFKRVSSQLRQMDPNHLQTIGWIDRARGKYFPDLNDYLDFWCFHFYDAVEHLGDLISFYKGMTTKPVLLEEFGLATGGPGPDGQHTELDQLAHYGIVYALLDGYKMCGSVFWTLVDFPKGLAGNPPLPDDSSENHYGVFRLDYAEKPVARRIRYVWTGSG